MAKNMAETKNLSIFEFICLSVLFIPYLLIDLFAVTQETTEYERRGR